jgi:predicted helicase
MGFEHTGKQLNFFGLTDANSERIAKQNSKPIMLVIGNPPYNANQANENENNKNREYPEIDKRIKDTYIKYSNAQKSKVYDMYSRFYRWASDRLDKNGIIAFITNNSFLDSITFDGFRKTVADEFSHIYVVDLAGNARKQEAGNVFGIKVGVAIAFFIKTDKKGKTPTQIFYYRPDFELATDKLDFLRTSKLSEIRFKRIQPDKNHIWLNQSENNWQDLMPIASKEAKIDKGIKEPKTIFKQFTLGAVTARDDWAYDFNQSQLEQKANFFYDLFNSERERWNKSDKKQAINNL